MAEGEGPYFGDVEENCEDIIAHWESRLPADFELDGEDLAEYKTEFGEFRGMIAAVEKVWNDYQKAISARDQKAAERHEKNKKYRPSINVRFDKNSPEYQSSPSIWEGGSSGSDTGGQQSGQPPLPNPNQ